MKKNLLALLLMALLPFYALAISPSTKTTLYEHLKEINAQWQFIEPTDEQLQPTSFENDTRRIQTHLLNVEQYLRNQSVAHMPVTLQQKRAHLLDVLHGYAVAAVFPQNYDFSYRIPYFIDAHNTACAVGYLIIADGHQALAKKIQRTNNYQYLLDMQYPELGEWVANSGFTSQELALIQPAYMASTPFSYLEGNTGTNGHVNDVLVANNQIYVGGSFTSINNVNGFSNIAVFDGSAWVNPAGGLDGEVHAMAIYNNELYVGGNFMGSENGVASEGLIKWNGTQWEAVNTLGIYGDVYTLLVFNDKLYAGGDFEFPTGALRGFLMAIDDTIGVILPDFPMGPVHSLAVHDGELVIGGDFTTTFNAVALSNIAKIDILGNITSIGTGVNTPVFAIATYQDDLYIGGRFYNDNLDTLTGFAYWNDTTWVDESIFLQGAPASGNTIHDFMVKDNNLYVGGKFYCCDGIISYYGENLAYYHRSGGYANMNAVTTFDGAVYKVGTYDNELVVGGMFDRASFGQGIGGPFEVPNLGGLAMKNDNWNSILSIENANLRIAVYPVPASGKVTFQVDESILNQQPTIKLFNALGQQVEAAIITDSQTQMDITKLQSGVYVYHLQTQSGDAATGRIVVE